MKLIPALVLALSAAAAAPANAAANFILDFETPWAYGVGIDDYYNGGTASDGTSGSDLGVSFSGVLGLSNDEFFTYYSGAPTMQGIAFAYAYEPSDTSFMNVASGVEGALSFAYASPASIVGAIRAYSGLNGTGTLLGSFDIVGNSDLENPDTLYNTWTLATFAFTGMALSFDFTGAANTVGFDNITAVPEPSAMLALLLGGAVVGGAARRRRSMAPG